MSTSSRPERIGSAIFDPTANDGAGGYVDASSGEPLTDRQVEAQRRIVASGTAGLVAIARPNATEEEKFLVQIAKGANLPGQGTRWEKLIAEADREHDAAAAREAALIAICAENAGWISRLLFEELHHQAETPTPITVTEWNDIVDHGHPLLVGPFAPDGPLTGYLEKLPETEGSRGQPFAPPPSAPIPEAPSPFGGRVEGGLEGTTGTPAPEPSPAPLPPAATPSAEQTEPKPPVQFGVKVNDVEQPVPEKLAKPEHEEFFLAIAHKIRHGIQVGWEEIEAGFHKLL